MKFFLPIIFVFSIIFAKAQEVGLWTDHLPYNSINDIAVRGNSYFCATNQGLFIYDRSEKEISTKSKVNGLNDIGINALAYNQENDLLIIGYKSGNIDLLSGNNVFNMADIKRASSYTGKKNINHIITSGNFAWVATDFGIVQLDIKKRIVAATYIIGPNGSDLKVSKMAIEANTQRFYAATPNGLYSGKMSDPLILFQFWQKDTLLAKGEINHVAALNGFVIANKLTPNTDDSVFYANGSGWSYLANQGVGQKLDMRTANNFLVLVTPYTSNFYRDDLTLKYNISEAFYEPGTYQPRCATMLPSSTTMLIGNEFYGLIYCEDVSYNERITPNGPYSSNAFGLAANNKRLYVAPGAIDEIWTNTFANEGIFTLNDFDWNWIKPEAINNTKDVVRVLIDPKDDTRFFAAAWGTGILEFKNDVLVNTWNNQTSGGAIVGPPGNPTAVRTGGIAFDDDGGLWVTSSLSERPLSVMRKDGSWENFNAGALGGSTVNVFDIVVNQLNQKWIRTRTQGILVMDDSQGSAVFRKVSSGAGSGNLPNNSVLDFAEDLDGEMWIGTTEGLVVLYSPQNIFRAGKNFDAQPILFEEDGVVQRLLGTEAILAIAVDGANKKWFGTQNSGVFYTSADGTETIHHFTAENSPLLSNAILDIAIDNITGEVYFATAEGIVSFKGSATQGFDEYTDVYAYPNPVRPGYQGPIYIKGLVTNAQVLITDVAGNMVFQTVAEGGQARWDGQNLNGEQVVSGVYMAYITDDLAEQTTVTKILVIR